MAGTACLFDQKKKEESLLARSCETIQILLFSYGICSVHFLESVRPLQHPEHTPRETPPLSDLPSICEGAFSQAFSTHPDARSLSARGQAMFLLNPNPPVARRLARYGSLQQRMTLPKSLLLVGNGRSLRIHARKTPPSLASTVCGCDCLARQKACIHMIQKCRRAHKNYVHQDQGTHPGHTKTPPALTYSCKRTLFLCTNGFM